MEFEEIETLHRFGVYSEDELAEMLMEDEITDEEAGFMEGYLAM